MHLTHLLFPEASSEKVSVEGSWVLKEKPCILCENCKLHTEKLQTGFKPFLLWADSANHQTAMYPMNIQGGEVLMVDKFKYLVSTNERQDLTRW